MENPLVSVVVPVYRVEQYLARCVESLLEQTLREIEIILVDDGSPDNSGALCDRYAAADSRVKVIHKENGGLPSARNAGIAVASGEYLGFVDSDDWVDREMYRELYQAAREKDADLAVCDYIMVGDRSTVVQGMKPGCAKIGEQILSGMKPIACNKLFRRSCGLLFYEELRFAEDRPTVIPFLTRARRFAYLPKPFYYYFQRNESIVDGYARNASCHYDIQSLRLMVQDSGERYRKQVAKYCADTALWSIANPARSSSKADMIEFLQELSPLFLQNRYVKDCKGLQDCLTRETIPRRLVYLKMEEELSPAQQLCVESWQKYGADLEVCPLDPNSCNGENLPPPVRRAWEQGELSFVGDYLRVKALWEKGGIVVDFSVRLTAALGEMRAERTFFGYLDREEISDAIFGSVPGAPVLGEILATYHTDHILNDTTGWKLSDRIQSVLKQYGMREDGEGATQILRDGVCLYHCSRLSVPLDPRRGVARLFTQRDLTAEQEGMLLLSPAVAALCSRESQTEESRADRHQIRQLQTEVERLKNSRSWRFTRPLRRLFNRFRTVKYSDSEIQ